MDREIVNPHHQDGDVDREDAEHKDEDRVGVVAKVMVRRGPLYSRD